MVSPTRARPTGSIHGLSNDCATSAQAVPSTAISAKVRTPALAVGLRSRSVPTSRPMTALTAKVSASSSVSST